MVPQQTEHSSGNSPGPAGEFSFLAENEEATQRLGAALAKVLPAGTVVSLKGTLGAGKTRLVQAIAEACGVSREAVTSPTFVLCNEYPGSRMIYHFDAYRVGSQEEFRDLGVEDYYDTGGVLLVEWGDRVAGVLPEERVEIRVEVTGPTSRRFTISSSDPRMKPQGELAALLAS